MVGYWLGFYIDEVFGIVFDMVMYVGVCVIGKENYGIVVGCDVSFVVVCVLNVVVVVVGVLVECWVFCCGESDMGVLFVLLLCFMC